MELEKVWSGWKIDKLIGEGSFGKVYKVVRTDFGHTYEAALKVIEIPQNQSEYRDIKSEGMSDESVQEYFKSVVEDLVNEFALMAKLKGHSNIVSYEDHAVVPKDNEFGWEIFIRMELLTPLFSYLEEHELTVKDVIQMGIDMCRALEVCQKYNIVHRDIKPENIFVSDIGTFKLGDFGIARQLDKTTSGMSKKGTYTYMAPELYKGQECDSKVDIYSLGIVLYRFLNNNRGPFMPPAPKPIKYTDKEQANIMRLSGQKMPKPCNAEGRLAEIVLKACAYDPKDRYESPYVMRQELQNMIYSEEERKIAYPTGDVLANDKNEYTSGEKTTVIQTPVEDNKGKEQVIVKEKPDNQENNFFKDKKKVIAIAGVAVVGIGIAAFGIHNSNSQQSTEVSKESVEMKGTGDDEKGKEKQQETDAQVQVPDLQNKNITEAEQLLQSFGLAVEKTYEPSENIEKDFVISQQEPAGSEVPKDSTIHVVVCSATVVKVPNVTNISQEEAKAALEQLGFSVKVTSNFSKKVAKGNVISQTPNQDEQLEKGQEVTLTVSNGEKLITVPDVTGMKKDKAKSKLTKLGLKVIITEDYNNYVAKGKVVRQNIEKSKQVKEGTKIKIKISKGSKPVPQSSYQENYQQENSNSYTEYDYNTYEQQTYAEPDTTKDVTYQPKTQPPATKPKNGEDLEGLEGWEVVN